MRYRFGLIGLLVCGALALLARPHAAWALGSRAQGTAGAAALGVIDGAKLIQTGNVIPMIIAIVAAAGVVAIVLGLVITRKRS